MMTSAAILLWLLVVICASGQIAVTDFVKVECKTYNVGQYGQQSMLDCWIATSKEVKDPTVKVVVWRKAGHPVLVFDVTIQTASRFSFAKPSWSHKNMNVSLLIANTSVADEGEYTCMVITDSGKHSSSTNLKVTAKYSTPIIHSTPKSQATLTCNSNGGYPKGRLGWFVGPNRQEKSTETNAKDAEDGLFNLSSNLTLLPGSESSEYTCVVFNGNDGKDDEATLQLKSHTERQGRGQDQPGTGLATRIVAPLVVIGAIIIGLLLWKKVSRRCFKCRTHRMVAQDEEAAENAEPDDQLSLDAKKDPK
uniref:CD276 antigen homolog n=1 Tax=Doryrhamphus excisus TaxID=161450 RepID=UPI0025ADF351|nr:CD276 antigen homolog [Doryrhamphus excisus]XP_057947564.1 CD276 antigen homolog [Doryrhamphus excisus]